jgi:hypothetical protein
VRVAQFLGALLYAGYLVHVGLLMIILPWSAAWAVLLVALPPRLSLILDEPVLRGAVSGFGALHLLLLLLEVLVAQRGRPLLEASGAASPCDGAGS